MKVSALPEILGYKYCFNSFPRIRFLATQIGYHNFVVDSFADLAGLAQINIRSCLSDDCKDDHYLFLNSGWVSIVPLNALPSVRIPAGVRRFSRNNNSVVVDSISVGCWRCQKNNNFVVVYWKLQEVHYLIMLWFDYTRKTTIVLRF